MKNLKKLPTKQLEKFSNIFMQLGLVLVLFIVYVTLEHQTEQETAMSCNFPSETETVYLELDTEILFTREPKKIVPKVEIVKYPLIIDEPIKEVENNVPETIIDLPKDEPVPISPNDIVVVDIPEEPEPETVPFITIQNAPVFKGCEGLSKEDNKRCFDKKMKKFVHRNFDTELANELGLHSGVHKIQTQFLINEKGNVVDVKIRAPHNQLKKETNRLIKKLPKFTPGKQRDKPVRVRYTLPIAFRVE